MRYRFNGMIDRGYTDLAVVVGHTMRDAEDLYRRILRDQPENLLGYNVLLTTAMPEKVEGLRCLDFFISKLAWNNSPKVEDVHDILYGNVLRSRYRNPHRGWQKW